MGIGWERRAGGNKFEFAKDLMERSSSEKFWKGNGNDVLSATEGNTESRGWGGMCDWREGRKIFRSRYDRVQARRSAFSRKGTNQVLLSRGWH